MEERFWSKVNKTSECWLWTGSCNRDGYGRFCVDRKTMYAHRASWFLDDKTIPEGLVLRHKCRNRNCVNPEHLETGTQKQNCDDRIRDGTFKRKLTEEQVRQIRARSTESQNILAKEFGVKQGYISQIISGKRWLHL